MKRFLSIVVLLGLTGLALNFSTQPARAAQDQTGAQQQQQPTDDAQSHESARAFHGKIAKAGDKLVLQDGSTQTAYQSGRPGQGKAV
jgi:hypothetical protein